ATRDWSSDVCSSDLKLGVNHYQSNIQALQVLRKPGMIHMIVSWQLIRDICQPYAHPFTRMLHSGKRSGPAGIYKQFGLVIRQDKIGRASCRERVSNW